MQYVFHTPTPPELSVELNAGDLTVDLSESDQVVIEVTGTDAESVVVEQHGDRVSVQTPRRTGFLSTSRSYQVRVSAPERSRLVAQHGSAGATVHGPLGSAQIATGSGSVRLDEVDGDLRVKTGSGSVSAGDIRGVAEVKTGSGSVTLAAVTGPAEVKTGSGDICIATLHAVSRLSTGSGSIEVRHSHDQLQLKSGSGDLSVDVADSDVALAAASGDLAVGRVARGRAHLTNASGNIDLRVAPGVPVWTDLTTVTGQVRSTLPPLGAPTDGQEHVEVHARTVTGDIHLGSATA